MNKKISAVTSVLVLLSSVVSSGSNVPATPKETWGASAIFKIKATASGGRLTSTQDLFVGEGSGADAATAKACAAADSKSKAEAYRFAGSATPTWTYTVTINGNYTYWKK